jgi:hypothetical protein
MSVFDDERDLQALFDEVEPPASLEGSWGRPRMIESARRQQPTAMRAAAVIVAVLTVGAVAFGVAASDRLPGSDDDPSVVVTDGSTAPSTPPPTSDTTTTVPPAAESPPPGTPGGRGPVAGGTRPPKTPQPPPIAPARGPLTEWPDAANTGIPPEANLTAHNGDLHVDKAGTIVHDIVVRGTVYVEAADVTLRRVQVAPPAGATAGVVQRAPRLRIEDSEVTGVETGVLQEANGLTVQRSDISRPSASVVFGSDVTLVDNYLSTVSTPGRATKIALRHNRIQVINLNDGTGPVTDVTIERNRLGGGNDVVIWAPAGQGSERIKVTKNSFLPNASGTPSSGWNGTAPGNVWADNVWDGTTNPVDP